MLGRVHLRLGHDGGLWLSEEVPAVLLTVLLCISDNCVLALVLVSSRNRSCTLGAALGGILMAVRTENARAPGNSTGASYEVLDTHDCQLVTLVQSRRAQHELREGSMLVPRTWQLQPSVLEDGPLSGHVPVPS